MVDRCTISSVVPYVVAHTAARAAGVDAGRILAPDDASAAPRADDHVPVARYLEVWRRALHLVGDPAFALRVASVIQLEDSEVFGFLAMSCETLGEAFDRTASYRALFLSGARWELQIDPGATRMIWYPWPGDVGDSAYRAAMDLAVADMAGAAHRLGRAGPRPTAVRMAHRAPPDISAYTAFFTVAPTFGAPLYELVYPPGLRDMPISSFNSKLRDYFDEACRRLAPSLGAVAGLVDQVRKALLPTMGGGDTSIESTARSLGMSSRSLQRRLADEGTRYNDVLADIRAEFAKRYLARGTVSVGEVAFLLGFSEPPAFSKAFKKWTGMTPREFQQGADPG